MRQKETTKFVQSIYRTLLHRKRPIVLCTLCFFILFCLRSLYTQSRGPRNAPLLKPKQIGVQLPQPHVAHIDCSLIFAENMTDVLDDADEYLSVIKKVKIPDIDYIKMASNCEKFKDDRRYITDDFSQEEMDFPIAFSIAMYRDVEQVERLLRALYRSSNVYCIHVDGKAEEGVYRGMQAIAGCFDNVFLGLRRVKVTRGTYSVLEADLVCMEELLDWRSSSKNSSSSRNSSSRNHGKWKYYINLTGQEFPLNTNLELVRILKAYDGANDVERVKMHSFLADRTRYVWIGEIKTDQWKPEFGRDVHISKGSPKVAVTREFVEYAVNSDVARAFRIWLQDTYQPEETFFASLNHSPDLQVPGSYKGPFTVDGEQQSFTRYIAWEHFDGCNGKTINNLCILGVGDLPLLVGRPEMVANKFYLEFEHLGLDCLEEWFYNRTRGQYMEGLVTPLINISFYQGLDFVKNHW